MLKLSLVEDSEVRNCVSDCCSNVIGYGSRFVFIVAETQSVRRNFDAIEAREGITDCGVTSLSNIFNEFTNRRAQCGFEDVIEAAVKNLLPRSNIHFRPPLNSKDTHHLQVIDAIAPVGRLCS